MALVAVAPLLTPVAQAHPEPNDLDGDLIVNAADNCPVTPNGAQVNSDAALLGGDGLGDACDDDDDADGVPDVADNCRIDPNPDQIDSDGNGRGDACPAVDIDLDGIDEDDDNCLTVPNPDQADLDGDDKGDACDRDDDNDRYDDGFDNCPVIYNPDQADFDGDGIGSACDPEEAIAAAFGAGPPGGAGAGGGGPGASSDHTAPTVTVTVDRRLRLSDAGRSLVIRASCSEACTLDAVVSADAKAARRARLGGRALVVARGSWSLAATGRTYVFARWTATARRLRSGRRLQSALRLTATDVAGNTRAVTRPIDLRR